MNASLRVWLITTQMGLVEVTGALNRERDYGAAWGKDNKSDFSLPRIPPAMRLRLEGRHGLHLMHFTVLATMAYPEFFDTSVPV